MAIKKVQAPSRYIGLSTDTKLSDGSQTVNDGATSLEADSGVMWITPDHGATWYEKSDVVRGKLKTVSVSVSTVETGGYAANDVISNETASGSTFAFAAVARTNAGYGYITGARVKCSINSITPRWSMYLFHTIPTAAELDDSALNIAIDGSDSFKSVGQIDWAALETLNSGYSQAIASPSTLGNLPIAFNCASGADDLYGVLVTRDSTTMGSGTEITVDLTVEQY